MAATEVTYTFFDAVQLTKLERERRETLEDNRILAQIMPWTEENTDTVLWDVEGNIKGLLPVGGRNETFPVLDAEGGRRISVTPGHFKGTKKVDADVIGRAADFGSFDHINVDDHVADLQFQLQVMGLKTRNVCRGQLLTLGKVLVPDKNNRLVQIATWEDYQDRFEELSAGEKWDTPADGLPWTNFREWWEDFEGTGHSYNSNAVSLMSRATANKMLACDEVKTIRDKYGATVDAINAFNEKLIASGDMPTIMIVESGYEDPVSGWVQDIADGYVVNVAYNDFYGIKAGNFVATRNTDNMGVPGIYALTDTEYNPPKLPRTHHSFSGGPRINYRTQIAVKKVY